MFRFAGITKSGFSILTEVLKNNKSLEFIGAEYYDSIVKEVEDNINNEKKLREEIEKVTIHQIENLGDEKCSLAVQNIFKEGNNLKVVCSIKKEGVSNVFRAMSGALFVKSPINNSKVLFAYFVAANEEEASVVDPNITEINGDYFIATFNFKNLDDYNIKYIFCENYSLPTIDIKTENNEDGEEEGCKIIINYGLKKYIESEDGEEKYEPIEKEFIVKHGEKGDVGPEGPMFSFEKSYKSKEEMLNDKENISIGKHVIIEDYDEETFEIGPDNGDIYQRIDSEDGYKRITKILGAKGQKGQDSEGKDLFNSIYPVGSIYTSINPKLPKEFSNDGRVWKTLPSGYMLQQAFDGDLISSGENFTIENYSEENTLKKIEEGIPDIFGEMLYLSKEWGSDGIGNGAFSKEASSNSISVNSGNNKTDINVGSAKFFAHNGEYRLSGDNNDVLDFPYRDELTSETGEKKYGVYKPGYEHVQPNAIRVNMWLRIK